MHPLVKQAARGLAPPLLERELLSLSGETLRDAVRELILLGVVIDENGGDASRLFALVESPQVIAALDRANASRVADQNEESARVTKEFARFGGERTAKAVDAAGRVMRLEDFGAKRFAGLKLR